MKKFGVSLLIISIVLLAGFFVYLGIVAPYRIQIDQEKNINKINTAWELENYEDVIQLSDEFLAQYPENAQIILLSGFAHFSLAFLNSGDTLPVDINQLWQSIHSIRQALVFGVNSELEVLAHYVLGKAYYLLSNNYLDKSIQHLTLAYKNNYKQVDLFEFLAAAYIDKGELQKGTELLENIVQKYPSLNLYIKLIDTFTNEKKYDKALDYISAGEELAKNDMEKLALKIRSSRLDLERGDIDSAINSFSSIIELYPQSVEAHFYLGNSYEKQGNLTKARYEWRAAYKLSPYWDKVIEKLDQE